MTTPLHLAVENCNKLCWYSWLERRNNSIHLFSFLAHENLVDLLLQNGANINAQNKNKHTPLHLAVRNGSETGKWKMQKLKFENYSNISGHEKITDLLLEKQAKLTVADDNGWFEMKKN